MQNFLALKSFYIENFPIRTRLSMHLKRHTGTYFIQSIIYHDYIVLDRVFMPSLQVFQITESTCEQVEKFSSGWNVRVKLKRAIKLWLNFHCMAIQKNSEHFPKITKHYVINAKTNFMLPVWHTMRLGSMLVVSSSPIDLRVFLWVKADDYY